MKFDKKKQIKLVKRIVEGNYSESCTYKLKDRAI